MQKGVALLLQHTAKNCAVVAAAMLFGVTSAQATFIVADNFDNDQKLFIDGANKNVSSFTGTVGSNNSGPKVSIDTAGNVDTGNGYANIKPATGETLTSLTFKPNDPNAFGDFSFRGQLEAIAGGSVLLVVQDNQGGAPQSIPFINLGSSADFSRVGIVSNDGETIKSVSLFSTFKEVKQVDFSPAVAVPEPQTYAILGLGVGLLGILVRRRNML
jgi:hypothetical protein